MNAVAATGMPIAPSSMSRMQVWMPDPRNVSGAAPTRTPFFLARVRMRSPSRRDTDEGLFGVDVLPGRDGLERNLGVSQRDRSG